mmetsp:Transcript_14752/g.61491  ORF Transcript_14752/g.61491 Transcript_14752/m.61491 type:complete len:266 (+) Transcript_14752:357-1154(+)
MLRAAQRGTPTQPARSQRPHQARTMAPQRAPRPHPPPQAPRRAPRPSPPRMPPHLRRWVWPRMRRHSPLGSPTRRQASPPALAGRSPSARRGCRRHRVACACHRLRYRFPCHSDRRCRPRLPRHAGFQPADIRSAAARPPAAPPPVRAGAAGARSSAARSTSPSCRASSSRRAGGGRAPRRGVRQGVARAAPQRAIPPPGSPRARPTWARAAAARARRAPPCARRRPRAGCAQRARPSTALTVRAAYWCPRPYRRGRGRAGTGRD